MLPELNKNGYLPPGIHKTDIRETTNRFIRPRYKSRQAISEQLLEFFDFIQHFAVGIYIDGSYVTSKLSPSDVDVLVILPNDFDHKSNYGWRLNNYRNSRKKSRTKIDVFFQREEDKEIIQSRLDDWCKDRDANPRGIVYVEIEHDKK